jgi:pyrroline-5-carboxylate reductase
MPLKDQSIALLGAGNMGEALLRGLIRSKLVSPERIIATGPRAERLGYLAEAYGVRTTHDNVAAMDRSASAPGNQGLSSDAEHAGRR